MNSTAVDDDGCQQVVSDAEERKRRRGELEGRKCLLSAEEAREVTSSWSSSFRDIVRKEIGCWAVEEVVLSRRNSQCERAWTSSSEPIRDLRLFNNSHALPPLSSELKAVLLPCLFWACVIPLSLSFTFDSTRLNHSTHSPPPHARSAFAVYIRFAYRRQFEYQQTLSSTRYLTHSAASKHAVQEGRPRRRWRYRVREGY